MLRLLLVLAFLPPQDDDLRALVRRLGDDDPATRDRASRALEKRGQASAEALAEAMDSPDLEVRTRAATLLGWVDPSSLLASRIIAQRELKLRLIAGPHPVEEDKAYVDGVELTFERRRWIQDGKTRGSVIHVHPRVYLDGDVALSVASARSSRDLPVERCSVHSPGVVFIPDANTASCTVVVKGVRRWLCDVPVRFRDPVEGERRRVGRFTLTLKWPHVVVRCDDPLPPQVVTMMLGEHDLRSQTPESLLQPAPEIDGSTDEPAIFFPEAREDGEIRKAVWCGCSREPGRSELPPATSQKRFVRIPAGDARGFHDLAEVALTLHVPVEEPFEVTSPPLRY
jgi:hypothetical protein